MGNNLPSRCIAAREQLCVEEKDIFLYFLTKNVAGRGCSTGIRGC